MKRKKTLSIWADISLVSSHHMSVTKRYFLDISCASCSSSRWNDPIKSIYHMLLKIVNIRQSTQKKWEKSFNVSFTIPTSLWYRIHSHIGLINIWKCVYMFADCLFKKLPHILHINHNYFQISTNLWKYWIWFFKKILLLIMYYGIVLC